MQRYTSFKAHDTTDGPVRQILVHEKGIIALGSRSVHMALRRGPSIWHIKYAACFWNVDDVADMETDMKI